MQLYKRREFVLRKPNNREKEVLRTFSGTPEPWARFSGAGKATLESLLAAGWIRPNSDPDYPADYYEITPEGDEAAYR